jgi:hypothetical protein
MSSHETESYAFRTRLVVNTILPTFILPPLFCATLLRVFSLGTSLDIFTKILAGLASIPLFLFIRIQIRRRRQSLEAQRLGARMVPSLRGKWLGNLDILIGLIKAPQRQYILDGAKEKLESLGMRTVNTNFFWEDQVRGLFSTPIQMIGIRHTVYNN